MDDVRLRFIGTGVPAVVRGMAPASRTCHQRMGHRMNSEQGRSYVWELGVASDSPLLDVLITQDSAETSLTFLSLLYVDFCCCLH